MMKAKKTKIFVADFRKQIGKMQQGQPVRDRRTERGRERETLKEDAKNLASVNVDRAAENVRRQLPGRRRASGLPQSSLVDRVLEGSFTKAWEHGGLRQAVEDALFNEEYH